MAFDWIPKPPENIMGGGMLNYFNDIMNLVLDKALSGDPEAMGTLIVGMVGVAVGLIVLYKASKAMFGMVKRLLLFFIVLAAVGAFFFRFADRIFVPHPDPLYMILGVFGVGSAIISLIISIVAFSEKAKAARTLRQEEITNIKEKLREQLTAEEQAEFDRHAKIAARPTVTPTAAAQPKMVTQQAYAQRAPTVAVPVPAPMEQGPMGEAFTTKNLLSSFEDRSILTVFTYVVVAEFGVFSSVTVAAPNPMAGVMLFLGFLIGAFAFIRKTYHSYLIGVSHLFIGTIFALGLSIVLGNLWAEIAIEQLLSVDYFMTPALVAAVTGVAISLFMGSKE